MGGLSSLQRTNRTSCHKKPKTFLRPMGLFLTTQISARREGDSLVMVDDSRTFQILFTRGFSFRPLMARTTQQRTHAGVLRRLAELCANAVSRWRAQDSHTLRAPKSRHRAAEMVTQAVPATTPVSPPSYHFPKEPAMLGRPLDKPCFSNSSNRVRLVMLGPVKMI